MSRRPSISATAQASLAGMVVAVVFAVLLAGWPRDGSDSSAQDRPPSKSPRELADLRGEGEIGVVAKTSTWVSGAAQAHALSSGSGVMVLSDGTVVSAKDVLNAALSPTGASADPPSSSPSTLRRRLLERAGKLAVHGEEPWKALVLVATAYHRAGDLEARQVWFERAIRLAADPDSSLESSVALRDVVKGLVSVGEIEQGMDLVSRIPLPKYRELATAEIVRALAFRRQFDRALRIAGEMSVGSPRVLALRGIAEAQARFDSVDHALVTVFAIPAGRSRDDALSRVALARGSSGDRSGAARLVGLIKNARIKDLALVRLADLVSRSSKAGAPEAYLTLLHDPFLRDESLLRLVEDRVAQMKFTEAQLAATGIQSEASQAVAMELLVSLEAQRGDFKGALKRARRISVVASRDRALQSIAMQQIVRQGAPAARFTAELISSERARDVAYRRIAERTASLGANRQITPTIEEIVSPVERATAYASVARLQARGGNAVAARDYLYEAIHTVEYIQEKRNQWTAMSMLATAHLETGDDAAALRVAAGISDVGLRDRTYQQLSQKLAGLSEIALAEESAQAIAKSETREKALDGVARVVAGRTRATEALGRLHEFDGRRQQVKFLLEVAKRI